MYVNNKWLRLSAVLLGGTLGIIAVVFDVQANMWTIGPVMLLTVIAYVIAIIWTSIREQKNVVKILMVEGQPDLYLQKMKILQNQFQSDKYKRLMEINIASGLIYEGSVDDALTMLEALSLRGFNPMHKGVYYNNLAFAYLMKNRVNEAQDIFKTHIGEMLAADRDPMVKSCARCTQAILDYKQNRIEIALETLERLLEKDLMPLQKSVALYYRGLILKKIGKEDPKPIFKESSIFAGETVFRKLSEAAAESL